MMNDGMKGKTAFVTGSSRGIGKAIAVALAECGCDVIINYQHSEESAAKAQKEIESKKS